LVDVWGTAGAFTFQGALGAVSAVFLLGVRPAFPFPQQAYQPWLRRLNEGVAAIRATTWVWGTILLSVAGTAVAAGALSVVIPLYIKEDLGLSATVLGTLNSAGAAGALVVAVLIGQARALPRGGVPAYAGVAVAGASVIAYAFLTTPATLLSASAIGWGGLAVFTLTWNTALQRRIPSQLLGRVAGVDGFASLLLVPAAVPLMGVATEALGAPTVMVAGGAVIIALAVVAAAVPVMRRWG
jgi:DHA3 family tetracycline resistance protein-like MFS transporter